MTIEPAPALQEGDLRDTVARWFSEHQAALHRYLTRLVGDEERAAELLQETFVRALTALRPQRLPDNPSAWLYRIATNLAYDALRRRRLLSWLPLSGREQAQPFEGALATAQLVRRCLHKLGRREAEALLLYEYAGLSCVEIAALTGAEPTAIRMCIHRARKRFRDLYEKEAS